MKVWKWKGVQFRPTENVQSQFALSYLLIIAAVLILLNTYPLLACQTLVFQAKQSILTEAQMIASNLAELGELGESGVEQVMTLVGDSNLTRIVVTDSDAQLLYDTQESARPHRYALFQELTQALDGQDVYHASFRDNAFRSEAAVPVIYCGNTIGGVYLYKYDTEQADILLGLQSNLRNITLVVCVFAVLVSVILSRMMTRRMNDLLAAIRAFHSGSDTQPISVKGKDQLAKMADEFNQLTERIQETDAMRRQFVADASHELKTPLTSIRLLSDSILQDPEMEPELIREFVGDIGREAQRLSRITEGLLSLTQLDRGIQEQSGVIDVSGQVRYAIHLLLPLAEAKDIVLHSQLESNCLVLISGDNMAHIANNLIENAIKYNTPGGSVWIRLAIIQEDAVFTVEDTGIGIPPEEREKVFERFYRVDKARSREAGGTGLGLSIVHDTVLQAGGSIRLTEGCAGGACFQVTLPLAREESA